MTSKIYTAIFVEPGIPINEVVGAILEFSVDSHVIVVCANYPDEASLLDAISDQKILHRSVEIYNAALPRPDVDGETWIYARAISSTICNRFRRSLRSANLKDKISVVTSFQERCDDTINRYIRPATHFRRLVMTNARVRRVVSLTGSRRTSIGFIDALAAESAVAHVQEWILGLPDRFAPVKTWRFIAPNSVLSGATIRLPNETDRGPPPVPLLKPLTDVLIITHTRDPLYRTSLSPLIEKLSSKHSVQVWGVNSRAADRKEHARPFQQAGAEVDFIALESLQPPSQMTGILLKAVLDEAASISLSQYGDCPLALVRYALATAGRSLPATFGYVEAVKEGMEAATKQGVKVIILAPGRLLESRILAREASQRGISTVEPQLGTWSDSPKFLAPLSDYILSQDTLGDRLFKTHFGLSPSRVHLVGTPKTDEIIIKYKNLSKSRAKKLVDADVDENLIVFASQPFADDVMVPVVEMFLRVVHATGVEGRILLHPREGEDRKIFTNLIRKYGLSNRVSTRPAGSLYEHIRASDVFLTYCSGSGSEAFALNRPVVVLNPHTTPMPLNLVDSGVGDLAADSESATEITSYFLRRKRSFLPKNKSFRAETAQTLAISDGRALDRTCEFIESLILRQTAARNRNDGEKFTLFYRGVRRGMIRTFQKFK